MGRPFGVVRQNGAAGRRAWPGRLAASWLALGLVWSAAGHATVLYRCLGTQGEAVFASHAEGYRGCRRLDEVALPSGHGRRADAGRAPVRAGASAAVAPAPAGPAAPSPVLRGAVYRVRRADGSLEYTNLAPAHAEGKRVERMFTYIVTCMACSLHSPIHWQSVPLRLADYAVPIEDASRRFGVDPALLRAVIHAESAFNPRALSLKGAQGLMQLMPGTASAMGVADAFDADQNIHGGARYLARLLQLFHGDVRQAAAAYDAGAAAVQHYGGVPPYAETQVYVQRVELLFQRYRSRRSAGLD